jgi:predicted Fe-S protein YdhL (DUF1289 family)
MTQPAADDAVADQLQQETVDSPCIGTCRLDALQVCVGCGRTIGEIGAWFRASNEERRVIVAAAQRRRGGTSG